MTRTELKAYDRDFLDGVNLRVGKLDAAEVELARRRDWARPLRLGLAGSLVAAGIETVALVWLLAR